MSLVHRVLVKTHHIKSRKKILALTKAAKRLACAVVLKTGKPPGIMLAEGESALEWLEIVKKLRYKDYHLLKKEPMQRALQMQAGSVVEFTSLSDFSAFLTKDDVLYDWWRVNMGYKKSAP